MWPVGLRVDRQQSVPGFCDRPLILEVSVTGKLPRHESEIAPRLQSASRGAVPQLRSSPPRLRRSLSQHHWNPLQSWIWERKRLKAL